MNALLWVAQAIVILIFGYSGVMKSTQSERRLIAIGMTGVEHLPVSVIRFIGLAELAGVLCLLMAPFIDGLVPLRPIAALCLGLIMLPAGVIHYRRGENQSVWLNGFLLLLCLWLTYTYWQPGS